MIVVLGAAMGLLGTTLIGATLFSKLLPDEPSPAQANCAGASGCPETVQYTVQRLPSPTASPTAPLVALSRITATATAQPTLTPLPASQTMPAEVMEATSTPTLAATHASSPTATAGSVSPTVTLTATQPHTEAVAAAGDETDLIASSDFVEPYTSTNQVAPPPAAAPEPTPEPEAASTPLCPATSSAHFDLIPIEGIAARDYPDAVHGDLNLALRGFVPVEAPLEQVDYNGSTDANAPRLHGLFEPNRQAQIVGVARVNDWNWEPSACGGHPRGCPAPPSDDVYWPVTMIGLAATPGETIYIPERGPEIYPGGYIAMVLYAEEKRLTLGYTRRDTVSAGYTVHLENICVDPNLLALYNAQMDAAGWHATGHLPALRNNQAVGTAIDHQIGVAIRDIGTFMDPRSHKDWWK